MDSCLISTEGVGPLLHRPPLFYGSLEQTNQKQALEWAFHSYSVPFLQPHCEMLRKPHTLDLFKITLSQPDEGLCDIVQSCLALWWRLLQKYEKSDYQIFCSLSWEEHKFSWLHCIWNKPISVPESQNVPFTGQCRNSTLEQAKFDPVTKYQRHIRFGEVRMCTFFPNTILSLKHLHFKKVNIQRYNYVVFQGLSQMIQINSLQYTTHTGGVKKAECDGRKAASLALRVVEKRQTRPCLTICINIYIPLWLSVCCEMIGFYSRV